MEGVVAGGGRLGGGLGGKLLVGQAANWTSYQYWADEQCRRQLLMSAVEYFCIVLHRVLSFPSKVLRAGRTTILYVHHTYDDYT